MLHLQRVTKQYGAKVLFENAEANFGARSKVALIGPNGSGKSTLIRMILGQESMDSGQIVRANALAIGHLAQEVPKFSSQTVLVEVMRLDGRREQLLKARSELEIRFENDPTSHEESELERYGRILEELEHLDEYRLESRAKSILQGMGFKASDFDRSLSQFSGGWLMRVALSRLLLMDPDLLLLDEPTNHLDLETILWLEEFLRDFKGAMLLVSHDSSFLNRVVSEVIEIDQNKLWSYRGNLESYAVQKQERLTLLKSQFDNQQTKIAEIEAFVARFGAKATKARQAQSRLKQLEKMERIELPEDRASVRFRFPPAPHSGKEVITVKKAQFGYGDKVLFENLNWVIQRGSRVAIVGVNGAGKTTLLKLLSGGIKPQMGEVKFGHEVKVGYYAQHQAESLDMQKTIMQELEQVAPDMPMSQVRGIAGAFLFSGDAVKKKCGVLSGGEKARVALAKMLLTPSNLLILDEPTNHLDVESKGVLLDALQDYEGTLCIVSHDRGFVSPLVDTLLEIIPNSDSSRGSQVNPLLGGYEDYLGKKLLEASQVAKLLNSKPKESQRSEPGLVSDSDAKINRSSAPSNNQKRAWEKQLIKLEAEITRLETQLAKLTAILADSSTYDDKVASLKIIEEQRVAEKLLHESLAEWERVSAALQNNN